MTCMTSMTLDDELLRLRERAGRTRPGVVT